MYLDCNGKHSWTKFQHPECSPETHRPLRPSHTTLQILDKPLAPDLPASGSHNVWWLTTEGRTSRAPRCWADIALKPSCLRITRLWWLKYSRWHELRICLAWSCHPAVSSARPRSDRLKKHQLGRLHAQRLGHEPVCTCSLPTRIQRLSAVNVWIDSRNVFVT